MQSPSCTNVRIRSTHDVHRIFYAVYLGILPMITRRLDAKEREALVSGCCYAWEDRGPHAITGLGIERFTEGKHWSASRVREEFLFYYEKWEPPKSRNGEASSSSTECPRDWDPLVKQTYSVYLQDNSPHKRKWHLTAYFTQATVDQLGTVDDIPELAGLQVPEGLFRSSRTVKSRRNTTAASTAPEPAPVPPALSHPPGVSHPQPVAGRVYAQFPPPHVLGAPAQQQSEYLPYTSYTPAGPSPPQQAYPRPPAPAYSASDPFPASRPTPDEPHPPPSLAFAPPHRMEDSAYPNPRDDTRLRTPPPALYHWATIPPSSTSVGSSEDHIPRSSYDYSSLYSTQLTGWDYTYGHQHASSWSPTRTRRSVSPADSHATSQFSSHSQSSSAGSHSPDPFVPIQTPATAAAGTTILPRMFAATNAEQRFEIEATDGRNEDATGAGVGLAPLHALRRHHPYRRDPVDDRALQSLSSRRV